MTTTLWELRFLDGQGTSLYTDIDVSSDVGQAGAIHALTVAARVSEGNPLADAQRCFKEGRVVGVVAHMGAVAYVVRHDLGAAD